jgi:hypothetical protein
MNRQISSCCLLAALVVFAGSSGCSVGVSGGVIRVTKPFEAKVAAKRPTDLHVNVPVGSVTINPGPADQEEVRVVGTLGGADDETLAAVSVTLSQDPSGKTTVVAKGPRGKSWKADLVITTPTQTSVNLTAGVGTVSVTGLEGRMNADLGVGNLTLDGVALTGDSTVKSGTGNVTVAVIAWPKNSSMTAETGVGNAKVRLPATLGVSVNASTGVGNVRHNGIVFQGNPLKKNIVGGTIKGQTTADPEGRTLTLKSGTGDVSVEGTATK